MAAHGIEIWEKIIGFGAWAAASLKAKTDGCLCWGVLNKLGSPGSGRMYLPKKKGGAMDGHIPLPQRLSFSSGPSRT